MTVSYTKDVATTSGLGVFWKLLFRFRGSLFKLIMYDYLLFLFLFFTISTLYRTVMSPAQKRYFEAVSLYFDYFANTMPISFVLGFYVNVIYGRWWAQYNTIPWPDTVAVFVTANIKGMVVDCFYYGFSRSRPAWTSSLRQCLTIKQVSCLIFIANVKISPQKWLRNHRSADEEARRETQEK
ncbi:unnamed protein product [Cyprideis torosa]|uniref:Bestrophin homolog n=1 Tax=Cyprideis torosa TaxID=163714 RepID=A0A7R8WQ50_9CRUS|nr:unnamed protein product [Cyprideis torosa]CAG0902060.1 unnamed protein product [Cyprideis torosa]